MGLLLESRKIVVHFLEKLLNIVICCRWCVMNCAPITVRRCMLDHEFLRYRIPNVDTQPRPICSLHMQIYIRFYIIMEFTVTIWY